MNVTGLLLEVENICEQSVKCFIAGGYLRDTLNKIPFKDLDIMVVPTDGIDAFEFVEMLSDLEGFVLEKDLTWLCEYLSDMDERGVDGVVMGKYKDVDTQFIFYREGLTQTQITEDMDMNICQITMNSKGHVVETEAFLEGFLNSEIVMMHSYSKKRQESRIKRMLEKYPDFSARAL